MGLCGYITECMSGSNIAMFVVCCGLHISTQSPIPSSGTCSDMPHVQHIILGSMVKILCYSNGRCIYLLCVHCIYDVIKNGIGSRLP